MRRTLLVLLVALLFSLPSFCKDKKKKQPLPDAVLNAHTVMVVVDPEAGASITNPNEQVNARAAVENALAKWGRFDVMTSASPGTDLIVEVRKASSSPTVIRGGGINQRPPLTIGGVGLGVPPSDGSPRMGTEVASPTDMFTVYLGGADGSRGPIVWRYSGKGVLNGPTVRAVEELKKAITESEEAKRQNNP